MMPSRSSPQLQVYCKRWISGALPLQHHLALTCSAAQTLTPLVPLCEPLFGAFALDPPVRAAFRGPFCITDTVGTPLLRNASTTPRMIEQPVPIMASISIPPELPSTTSGSTGSLTSEQNMD